MHVPNGSVWGAAYVRVIDIFLAHTNTDAFIAH